MKVIVFAALLALASADLASLFKSTVEPALKQFVHSKVSALLDSAAKLFSNDELTVKFVINFLKGKLEDESDAILTEAGTVFEQKLTGVNTLSPEVLKDFVTKFMNVIPEKLETVLQKGVEAVKKYKTAGLSRRQAMDNSTAPAATIAAQTGAPMGTQPAATQPAATQPAATARPCNKTLASLQEAFAFTKTEEFKDLTENQQLLTYEVLAATEGCKLLEFIRPDTVLRLFRLFNDMSVQYVSLFLTYLSENLAAEGVMVQ